MVNGSRYYRALESISIASALSTTLTIYPCQIRVRQHWRSKLQLPTARKKEWWPAPANSYLSTLWYTVLVGLQPATFQLLVRRATSIVPPTHRLHHFILFGVYRPGSQAVSATFFNELSSVFKWLAIIVRWSSVVTSIFT